MTTALVLDALNMAAWTRRHAPLDGLVCHNDAGSQYTPIAYTDRLDEIGAAPSIGTIADSYDKARASYCTPCLRRDGKALPRRGPLAFRVSGVPRFGWVEGPDVLVVGLV